MTTMTPAPARDLTPLEMDQLESELESDKESFVRMGNTLIRIRDGKGYKLRGYRTFEDYCARRWDISDRHGRRLIAAAETVDAVQAATGQMPGNERVARALAP